MAYRLGIDIGTTSTAAAVSVDGGPAQLIMLGASRPQLPSALVVTEDGEVLVGEEAASRATSMPGRTVVDPLGRLADDLPAFDDGTHYVAAESGVAALLAAVLGSVTAGNGGAPAATVLSHPIWWDDYQVSGLRRAAQEAGLPDCGLLPDLEAAARAVVVRADPGPDSRFVIMDLGGGSCTVGLAQRTSTGVEVLANEHDHHPSGDDLDEAVFRLVGGNLGDQGRELTREDAAARARAVAVRQACRDAKEILSTADEAAVTVEISGSAKTVRITRAEFESLIRPSLRGALAVVTRMLRRSSTRPDQLVGVALVGGVSRTPSVAELAQREWDLPVVVSPEPELDVAAGLLAPASLAAGPVTETPLDAVAATPVEAPVVKAPVVEAPVVEAPVVEAPVEAPDPESPLQHAPIQQAPVTDTTTGELPAREIQAAGPAAAETAALETAAAQTAALKTTMRQSPAPATPDAVGSTYPVDSDAEAATRPIPVPARDPTPSPPLATTANGPRAAASTTEQPMPEHLIFDYFSAASTEPITAVPSGSAAAVNPRDQRLAASLPTPPQRPAGPIQPGRPVPPGQRPGPPTQPYGGGSGGPGGPGGYPPESGGGGSSGSRRNLILAIVGGVVLVAAAVGIGFWLFKPKPPVTGTPGGQISASPASQSPVGPSSAPGSPVGTPPSTPLSTPFSAPGTPTGGASNPTGGGSTAPAPLPVGPALGQNQIVVPMRTASDDSGTRPLYLVDANLGGNPVKLPGPDGKLANPMLQPDRTTIMFIEGGVLHVMGSDGNGERDLTSREPAGCGNVAGASWSQSDPTVLVISCRISKNNYKMVVVDANGRLIRRLDAGKKRFGDVTISPDGQTVVYWASGSTTGDGGSLYTLPLIGTGDPKKITNGDKGLDGDPSWSPDGTQIAFRRLVGGAGGDADVYVMNADGSGERVVANTSADDIKPVWSPDGKNLLIVSNRKSPDGGAGKTWDLWLTRVSDGAVLDNFNLRADEITTPTWTHR